MKRLARAWIPTLAVGLSIAATWSAPTCPIVGEFTFEPAEANADQTVETRVWIRLVHLGDDGIADVELVFEDLDRRGETFGSLGRHDLASRETVEIEQTITVPQVEYARWRDGRMPRLYALSDREDPSMRIRVCLHGAPFRLTPLP